MIIPSFIFTLATTIHQSAGEYRIERKDLAMEKLLYYQPLTDVRDPAAIDRDSKLINRLVSAGQFDVATDVYEKGSYSRSFAELTFGFQGLPGDIGPHVGVVGTSDSGSEIEGMILERGKFGAKVVRILYHNGDNPGSCFVGGNPDAETDGCFAASGKITFDGYSDPITYSYNEHHDNRNDRTIAMFSKLANDKMRPCSKCQFYTEFSRMSLFFGKPDFADQWIHAALKGNRTVFDSSTADFESMSLETRAAAVTTATTTLSIFPYIEREMEEAIKQCKAQCPKEGCTDKAIRAVDTAAAFYWGSLEDGAEAGQLMYRLSNRECAHFKTCGTHTDSIKGTSKTNIEILHEFTAMQANVTARACPEARINKDHIQMRMKVPLIQGTLRYAYLRSKGKASDADIGSGSAFAASIVPFIAACNFKDAEIINNNMETTTRRTDFPEIKSAFERHYSCLGLTCKDIGGYWDHSSNEFFKGAEPCAFDAVEPEESPHKKKAFGWGFGVSVFVVLFALICLRRRMLSSKKKKARGGTRTMDDFSDSSDDSDGAEFT